MFNPSEVLQKVARQGNGGKSEAVAAPLKGVTLRGNKRGPDVPAGFAYFAPDGTKANLRVDLFPTSGVVEVEVPEGVSAPKEGTYFVRAALQGGKETRWVTVGYAVAQGRKLAIAFDALPPGGRVSISLQMTAEERAEQKKAKAQEGEGAAEEAIEEATEEAAGDFPEDPFQD
jgi:hypothetical protein